MIPGGGKQKGSAFERKICKDLSLWITNGLQEDVFWRSAVSGGRSTVASRKGKRFANQAGDLSSVHPAGHTFIDNFVVECKHYKDLRIAGLLTKTGNLVDFWNTIKKEAKHYEKLPMLIAKQNQLPVIVCLTAASLDWLDLYRHRTLWAPRLDMHIVLFSDFLDNAKFSLTRNEFGGE